MTAATFPAIPAPIHAYVTRFASLRRLYALLRAMGLAVAYSLAWVVLACVADRTLRLPGAARLALLLIHVVTIVVLLVRPVWATLVRRQRWSEVTADIEARDPALGERLQTVTSQLRAPEALRGSDQMLGVIAQQVQDYVAGRDPRPLFRMAAMRRPWLAAIAPSLLWVALLMFPSFGLPRLLLRYVLPLARLAPVTTTRLAVQPGNVDVIAGESVKVSVQAERLNEGQDVELFTAHPGDSWFTSPLVRAAPNTFEATLGPIDRDTGYRFHGGDAETEIYRLRVVRRPAIAEFRVRYLYPAYLRRPPLDVVNTDGLLEAPQGTEAVVRVVSTEPLAGATIDVTGQAAIATIATEDPKVREARLAITKDGRYAVSLRSVDGVISLPTPQGALHVIRAVADRPPLARLLSPAGDELRLHPRDLFEIPYVVMDDYGVTSLATSLRVDKVASAATTAPTTAASDIPVPIDGDPRRQEGESRVDLAMLGVGIGDMIELSVIATDGAGQTTRSTPIRIVVSPRSVSPEAMQRIAGLRAASAEAKRVASELGTALQQFDPARQQHDGSEQAERRRLDAQAKVNRALGNAQESAERMQASLLRTAVRSRSPEMGDALAEMVDAAQRAAVAADDVNRQFGFETRPDDEDRVRLQESHEAVRRAAEEANILADGESARSILADLENLMATTLPGDAASALARERAERLKQEMADATRQLGLDPRQADLEPQLRERVRRADELARGKRPLRFDEPARQWSDALKDRARRNLPLDERLAAAARAEAVRPDSDAVRARDMQMTASAAQRVQSEAATAPDPPANPQAEAHRKALPEALSDLHAEHALDRARRQQSWANEEANGQAVRSKAQAARQTMSRLAGQAAEPAPDRPPTAAELEALAAEANAATAERDFDRAAKLDAKLDDAMKSPAGEQPDSPRPSRSSAASRRERAMEKARELNDIARRQEALRRQTESSSPKDAASLSQQQQALAKAIEKAARPEGAASEARDSRMAASDAIRAAQEQLAAMPQSLNEAQSSASAYREASERSKASQRDAANQPETQRPMAERAAAAAREQAESAQARMEDVSSSVSPSAAKSVERSLRPFAPEATAATATVRQRLEPALRDFESARRAGDAGGVERAAQAARQAIEQAQNELKAAQADLVQRDPLVAAKWFAQAAARDLEKRPAQMQSALANQQSASAALEQAGDRAAQQAAMARLRSLPSMAGIFMPSAGEGTGQSPLGVAGAELGAAAAAPAGWNRLRRRGPVELHLSARDADVPGYQEALRAYFEALGQAGQEPPK